MTLMLASVVSQAEAEIAVERGADVIDCKDPGRGALGALPLDEVKAIVAKVNGRRPVSAVVELPHEASAACKAIEETAAAGLAFTKFALPATPGVEAIIDALAPLAKRWRLVAALFADLEPDMELLPKLARAGFAGVLLDTAHKGKGRLLDCMDTGSIAAFVARCRELGLEAGLAGSLEPPDVPRLLLANPHVLGFRGALCKGRDRSARLDPEAVTLIRDLVHGGVTARAASADAGKVDWSLLGRGYLDHRNRDIDHVFVRDLVIPVEVGAYGHERGRPQRVRFNVEVDVARAACGDDMRAVFSYDLVMDAIKMILASGHIELVETIAERLADAILLHERVVAASVQIEKLDVAPGAVGVRIRREKQPETAKVHHLFPGLANETKQGS